MTEPDRERMSALRANAHPLRLRILSLLTGSEMSAAEVARELEVTHANASYHLRVLLDAGLLVEAGEEKIRGGVAKRYRHPWRRPDSGPAPQPEDYPLFARAVAEEMVRRAGLRRPGTPGWTTDAEMWLPPEAWERALQLLREASTLVHEEARPPRTAGTVHVNLTAAAFQMQDGTEDPR